MTQQFDQLEARGFAVFPRFLNHATTAQIRAHMDTLLPPIAPRDDEKAQRLHLLRHPIPGAIMEQIITSELVELASQSLHPYASDLRLLEQVLIRTDPQIAAPPPAGWHIDMAFLPEHHASTPHGTYFHMVHCLNTVAPGGDGSTIVPGSHHQTFEAAQKRGEAKLHKLKNSPLGIAGVETKNAVEVCANEGDLLVFNPMAVHSSSANSTPDACYAYFASFHDVSAQYLKGELERTNYLPAFPASLRENLPAELRALVPSIP